MDDQGSPEQENLPIVLSSSSVTSTKNIVEKPTLITYNNNMTIKNEGVDSQHQYMSPTVMVLATDEFADQPVIVEANEHGILKHQRSPQTADRHQDNQDLMGIKGGREGDLIFLHHAQEQPEEEMEELYEGGPDEILRIEEQGDQHFQEFSPSPSVQSKENKTRDFVSSPSPSHCLDRHQQQQRVGAQDASKEHHQQYQIDREWEIDIDKSYQQLQEPEQVDPFEEDEDHNLTNTNVMRRTLLSFGRPSATTNRHHNHHYINNSNNNNNSKSRIHNNSSVSNSFVVRRMRSSPQITSSAEKIQLGNDRQMRHNSVGGGGAFTTRSKDLKNEPPPPPPPPRSIKDEVVTDEERFNSHRSKPQHQQQQHVERRFIRPHKRRYITDTRRSYNDNTMSSSNGSRSYLGEGHHDMTHKKYARLSSSEDGARDVYYQQPQQHRGSGRQWQEVEILPENEDSIDYSADDLVDRRSNSPPQPLTPHIPQQPSGKAGGVAMSRQQVKMESVSPVDRKHGGGGGGYDPNAKVSGRGDTAEKVWLYEENIKKVGAISLSYL